MAQIYSRSSVNLNFASRILNLNWFYMVLIVILAVIGFAMLYSAARGSWSPWALNQMIRFAVGFVLMFGFALVDLRLIFKSAYFWVLGAGILLLAVVLFGTEVNNSVRWLDLRVLRLQPSEIAKIAIIIALVRYFSTLSGDDLGKIRHVAPPLLLVIPLALLILLQPDLGTSVLLIAAAGVVYFAAGVRLWMFGATGMIGVVILPFAWNFILTDYQKDRIFTLFNPESDPLGSGWNIINAKIAFGSGGWSGKGFLNNTQGSLGFLPERQTDFIFALFAEEFGLLGCLGLLIIYAFIIYYGFAIAMRSANAFGRLLAVGLSCNLFFYIFVNMAMVMGVVPVVGVPLPLVSYGGTVMITMMISFGLIMSVYIHRDIPAVRGTLRA